MSRKVKLVGWMAGGLVLLLLVLVVAARLLVTPEGVRQALLPLAEKKLGRALDIGEIRIELFSGITLEKVSISSEQNGLPLFQADKALLHYRFWPLLRGKVMVDQISLQNPMLRLQRNTNGLWNVAELLGMDDDQATVQTASGGGEMTPQDAVPAATASGFNLLISSLNLSGGQLEITDQKLNPQAPYRFQLKEIGLKIRDFSLDRPFPLEATVQISSAPLQLSGSLDPLSRMHDLRLQATDFDLAPLAPYFREFLPGIFSRAKLTTDIRFSGNPERFDLKGKLTLNEVHLVLDALNQAPIRGASLAVEPDLNVDRSIGLVTVRPSSVALDAVRLQLSGSVEKIEDQPTLTLQVAWKDIGLRELLATVPSGLLPRLDQIDPAGKLSGSLDLRGAVSQPGALIQAGKISLVDVQANLGLVRPALSGELSLVGQGLAGEKLRLRLGDDQADISFTVKDVLSKPLQIQSQVQAGQIDVDRLLRSFAGDQPKAVQQERTEKLVAAPVTDSQIKAGTKAGAATETGPLDLPLTVDGTIVVQKILFKGLTVDDFNVGYRLADNLLDVRRMTGNMAAGRFNETGKVDLGKKGLSYETGLQLEGVQAGVLVDALMPEFQGSLSGVLNAELSLSGKGSTAESIKKNLSGKGGWHLIDGLASGTKLSRGLVNLLGMQQLEQIDIKTAEGTFQVKQGVVKLAGSMAGRDLQMAPEGTIRLNGPVDLRLPIRLAPKVAEQLGNHASFSQLLRDDEGWVVLPLKVKGSIEAPQVSLDEKQLGRQAEKKVKQELEQKLLEKLAPPPKEGEVADPNRKILKDTLRGLFGK